MVGEVIAGMGAIKSAFDIAKGLKDIDDATRRNAAIIELQEKILAAQHAQSELTQRIIELEKEKAGMEAWESEKRRYELKKFGNGFAFVLKADAQPSEEPHEICPNCHARGKKSYLAKVPTNVARQHLGMGTVYRCPECRTEL